MSAAEFAAENERERAAYEAVLAAAQRLVACRLEGGMARALTRDALVDAMVAARLLHPSVITPRQR